jgi:hypothetical protein
MVIINISILFIIFIVIVKYSQHTTEFSLERRWKLVNFIKEVKKDSEYNEEFIRLLENMFIDSIDKNFLPKFVFNILYIKFLANKNKFIESVDTYLTILKNINIVRNIIAQENEKLKEMESLIDFLSSKAVGEILSHKGFFPSVNPEVEWYNVVRYGKNS